MRVEGSGCWRLPISNDEAMLTQKQDIYVGLGCL